MRFCVIRASNVMYNCGKHKCTNASTARYSLFLCVYELLLARISEQKRLAGGKKSDETME